MRNSNSLKAAALVLLMAGGLAACSTDDLAMDDADYSPSMPSERFPITVAKGPVKMDVASHKGGLSPDQANSVVNFARQASSNQFSAITVSRPSGGGRGSQVAHAITELLMNQGIPPGAIVQRTYPGPASGPVNVSYIRAYAKTKECGDWSENLADTGRNDHYPNFGCAQQHNIAAMVSDPMDFEVPSGMGNVPARRRVKVMTDYGTAPSGVQTGQSVAISTAIR
ncbi:MAG: CpaD family pilus assembly protein [Aestuariivirga sp.]